MAAPAFPPAWAAGVHPGHFVLVLHPERDEADEYYVAARVGVTDEWIALTTQDEEPFAFEWKVLELRGDAAWPQGGYRVIAGVDAQRAAPPGHAQPINWICDPETLTPWSPTPQQSAEIVAMGHALSLQYQHVLTGPGAAAGEVPGLSRVRLRGVARAGRMAGLPMATMPKLPIAQPGGGMAPATAGNVLGPGSAMGAAPAAAVAPGLGYVEQPGPVGGDAVKMELDALKHVVDDMRVASATHRNLERKKKKKKRRDGSDDRDKKEKKESKNTKDKKHRKKKKKKGSDSGSSTSRSSSSSASSATSGEDEPMIFAPGSKKSITSGMVLRANTQRFKRRSDLINFHYKHPGGLAGHFLWQVRQRVGGEMPTSLGRLAQVDASHWVNLYAGVKDVRDQKEIAFLAKLMLEMGNGRTNVAADMASMRIREIMLAKRDGGSWDKASVVSLQPGQHGGHAAVPDGAFVA